MTRMPQYPGAWGGNWPKSDHTREYEAGKARLAAERAELVERLVNSGHTPQQAENVAGACSAYGKVTQALDVIRRS